MAAGDKIKWEEANFKWEKAPTDGTKDRYTWNDVKVLEEAALVFEGSDYTALEKLEDKKKKRIIHLVMRRRGIKMYDEMKEVKDIVAHADDIKLLINEVRKKATIKNINL